MSKLKRVIHDHQPDERDQSVDASIDQRRGPNGPDANDLQQRGTSGPAQGPSGTPATEEDYQVWADLDLDDESVFVGPTDRVDSFELYRAIARQNPHLPSEEFVMNPDLALTVDSDGLAVIHLVVAVNLTLPLQ